MKGYHLLYLVVSVLLGLAGCSGPELVKEGPPPKTLATLPLINCLPEMDQPEYWINRYPEPDKLLLTVDEIKMLNQQTYRRGLLTDVFSDRLWDYKYEEVDRPEEVNPDGEWDLEKPLLHSPGVLDGYNLYTNLKDETERIKRRQRWDGDGRPIPISFFHQLDKNLNVRKLKENNPLCYGLTKRRTNVRYYPTEVLITGRRWDTDFDIVQVSAIRALQPVVILHQSRDQNWLFVVTAFCRGWIKSDDLVSYCDPEAIKRFVNQEKKLVITGHAVEVVGQPGNTGTAEKFYMGTACPLIKKEKDYYVVALPERGTHGQLAIKPGYIHRLADVSETYLPYTNRNLLQQAFKLMHQPYSWGGKSEFRDCSQYLKDVYATFGLTLPRNSSVQARVGGKQYTFSRYQRLDIKREHLAQLDRPALLQFPGHIMLYLGTIAEHDYAIHDIWAYRVYRAPKEDDKVVIGKVVVSDLSLGQGSNRGSLLERLTTINPVQP